MKNTKGKCKVQRVEKEMKCFYRCNKYWRCWKKVDEMKVVEN